MAIVKVDKTIVRRLRPHNGLYKALAEFIHACQHDEQPPRVYKKSGVAKDGSRFEPYLKLDLYHHHLHRAGDPMLVTQHVGKEIRSVALAKHSDHILGDKMLWLQQNVEAIDWDGNEDLEKQVREYDPSKQGQ